MARIIVFGPHPDDQELGMGGTIALLLRQGHDVLIVDLTNGEPTPFGDPETRRGEAMEAARILSRSPDGTLATPGVGGHWTQLRRVCLGLPNRRLTHSVESRRLVAGAIRAWQADIVFVNHPEDAHPDHVAGTRIVEDARFDAKLGKEEFPAPVDQWTGRVMDGPGVEPETADDRTRVGAMTKPCFPKWTFYYFATHLRRVADPGFIMDISETADLKVESIVAYRTQFVLPEQNRKVVEWVKAGAVYFGSRIGAPAGEPLTSREPLGLAGFTDLVG